MTTKPPIELPLQLRALNAAGPVAKRLGVFEVDTDVAAHMRSAERRTGLDDFGSYDIVTPLSKMLQMLRSEADLHLFGRIAAAQLIRRNLDNCLKMQRAFVDEPSLAELPVDDPIIIICTPRTGSTLLHNLLAQHPNVRAPRMWELHRPCPPPEPALEDIDPRIRQSDREFGMYYRLVPEMRAIHYFAPCAVEECTHLFLNSFTCRLSFATMANLNSYTDWVSEIDMAPAYREYRRSLQVLTRNYPGRILVMKSPAHILCMEALHEVFPRARIVHIHRDPVTAAGSFCSLTEAVQISMRQSVDLDAIGDTWRRLWTPALMASIGWREKGTLNVLDLNFREVVANPAETAARVFEHFDLDAPDELATHVAAYLEQNPKDKYGSHSYDIGRYGLDPDALYAEYRPYIDHFGIPVES